MNNLLRYFSGNAFLLSSLALTLSASRAQTVPPTPAVPPAEVPKAQTVAIPNEFIDPETHRRVLHLSRFPTDYAGVVYFTYNTFSADSRLALIDAQYKDKWRYLYTFDFDSMTIRPLVTDRLTQSQVGAPKSGHVYYLADNAAWVISL